MRILTHYPLPVAGAPAGIVTRVVGVGVTVVVDVGLGETVVVGDNVAVGDTVIVGVVVIVVVWPNAPETQAKKIIPDVIKAIISVFTNITSFI